MAVQTDPSRPRAAHDWPLWRRVVTWLLASFTVPSGVVGAITARADGPGLVVWLVLSGLAAGVYFAPYLTPERHPLLALQARWAVLRHPRVWCLGASAIATVAVVLAAVWTRVDDDLLYLSLGLAALGLLLLVRARRESTLWAVLLVVPLVVPFVELERMFSNVE